ncbi:unnamed protein product [Rhizophagus irregularis]|nr:unnamed protein product [Rhizophagus irregularis]
MIGLQQEIAFTISSVKISNFIKILQHIVTEFNLFEPLKEKVERIIHLENKTHEIKFITLEEKFKKLEELFEQNVPFHQTYSSIVLIKPSKSTSEIAMKM